MEREPDEEREAGTTLPPLLPEMAEETSAPAAAPPEFVAEEVPPLEPPGALPADEGLLDASWTLAAGPDEEPAPETALPEGGWESGGLVLESWEPSEAAPPPGAVPVAGAGEPGFPGELAAAAAPAEPELGEEAVDDWLAFVEGQPSGTASAARARAPEMPPALPVAPATDWTLEPEAGPSGAARPRKRGWFGRRRRGTPAEGEWPERAWTAEPGEEDEGHEPPPWPASDIPVAGPAEEGEPVATAAPDARPGMWLRDEAAALAAEAALLDDEAEAEAAWAAWEEGAPAGEAPGGRRAPGGSIPPGETPPAAGAWVPPEGAAAEPIWEAGEWAGEPAAPAGDWAGAVDEDEAVAPPAGLPEEEWEEASEVETAAERGLPAWPADEPSQALPPAAEDLEAAGWEPFPEPGKPLPGPGTRGMPAAAWGEAAPVNPPPRERLAEPVPPEGMDSGEEAGDGWEEFPEPGAPAPQWPAASGEVAPRVVPAAEPVFPEDEAAWDETGAGPAGAQDDSAWDEAGWGEAGPEPRTEQPGPTAGDWSWAGAARRPAAGDQPTMEMPPPVFDYQRPVRPQGPISEEILAGAVTMEHRGLAEEVAAADTAEMELTALSAPMPGVESGVVGFEDVAHLSTGEEMAPRVRSDLPLRVATGMVLAALLLGSLWVGGEFFAGFVGVMVMLGLGEFYGSLRRRGYQPLALFGFLGAAGMLVGTWFYGPVAIPVAAVATTILTFFYYAFALRRRDVLTNGGLTLLGMLWVTGTAAFAFPIAGAEHFRVLVLAIAVTVIATDVGAYFTGRAWGRRLMAPVLSPHKTWEGLAGGVVLGIGAAVAAGYFFDEIGIRAGAALGLVVAVMAPLGDLAESMLKRSLGVKDMGAILPGHGGILDRVDAFLFVLPAAWVLFETMGLLR